jgi:hypothetical protein
LSENDVLDMSFFSLEVAYKGRLEMLALLNGAKRPAPEIEVDDGKPRLEASAENVKNTMRFLMGSRANKKAS